MENIQNIYFCVVFPSTNLQSKYSHTNAQAQLKGGIKKESKIKRKRLFFGVFYIEKI